MPRKKDGYTDIYSSSEEEFNVINLDNSPRDIPIKKRNNSGVNIPDFSSPVPDGFAPYTRNKKQVRNESPDYIADFVPQIHNDQIPEETEPAENRNMKRPNKRRRRRKVFKFIVTIAIIFAVSFCIIFCCVAATGYKKGELGPNQYVGYSGLNRSSSVKNILLLGLDGTESDSSLRSDSMILVSIDSIHKNIKITSFMRDMWINIPREINDDKVVCKGAKLNSACSTGGAQLVCDTLELNFGIDIDHYVLVNFDMFVDIIDALGGIDVEVTDAEAKFINRTTRQHIESGSSVRLNGEEALVYCRIRKLDSDYMRTFRQRKVIKAIIQKIKKSGPAGFVSAAVKIMPKTETDMSCAEITMLSYRVPGILLLYDMVSTRIPRDGYSYDAWEGSQQVVKIDTTANVQYLYNFIYNNAVSEEDE